jgi:hypothetical protein
LNGRGPLRFVVADGEEMSLRATPVGGALALAVFVLGAAAVIAVAEDPAAKAVAALAAIAATGASGLLRAASEIARRRSHVPVLKRHQEHRVLLADADLPATVEAVSSELERSGFRVERVEDSQQARIVLASRGGWAFSGTMLAHAGLVLAIGALAAGPMALARTPLAAGLLALLAGVSMRLLFDPLVAWCAARSAGAATIVEVVVSGCFRPRRIAQRADLLAAQLERRLAAR